MALHPAKHF